MRVSIRQYAAAAVLSVLMTEFLTGNAVRLRMTDLVGVLLMFVTYGIPVIVILKFKEQWQLGWGQLFFFGVLAGIFNEGLLAGTLTSAQVPISGLSEYGHWLGVSWPWTVYILIWQSLHAVVYPIAIVSFRQEPSGQISAARGIVRGGLFTVLSFGLAAAAACMHPAVFIVSQLFVTAVMTYPLFRKSSARYWSYFAIGDIAISALIFTISGWTAGNFGIGLSSLLAGCAVIFYLGSIQHTIPRTFMR